jgi:C4-dicarboxylate transporter, DctM subunit
MFWRSISPNEAFRFARQIEMGLLSPPFGISVFTVKATLNDPRVSIETIFGGAMPYFAIMGLVLTLIVFLPWMSTALV